MKKKVLILQGNNIFSIFTTTEDDVRKQTLI